MASTPFPYRASDVIALTVPEFTCALDLGATASFESACRRFLDDANKTLVWFIRFRALTGWCECGDTAAWLRSKPTRVQRARELAASFDLNDDWQFDAERFRLAVEPIERMR